MELLVSSQNHNNSHPKSPAAISDSVSAADELSEDFGGEHNLDGIVNLDRQTVYNDDITPPSKTTNTSSR
ncbi:MAG: hypothetical protein LBQ41_00785 [Candidatus Ancillula sp.]|nr:hypothetical protein [Candidatus Ancillula sp.]